MSSANKSSQLEGPQKVGEFGEFGESSDSGEIFSKVVDGMSSANKLTQLEGSEKLANLVKAVILAKFHQGCGQNDKSK